jgi:hypothetical protein
VAHTSLASILGVARLLVLPAALCAAGCNAGSPSTGSTGQQPPPVTGPTCADIADQCAANQQGCVEGSSGASCEACGQGQYAGSAGACEMIQGTPLTHTFPTMTVTAGQEQLGQCRSWTLNNDEDLWVSAVEFTQDEDSHHSNWTFVPDTDYTGPDGDWTCSDRNYDFYSGIAAGGLVYAQSTQATHEVEHFPSGAAIRIPAHSRIISDIHLLNTSSMSVTGDAVLTLYTLPQSQVAVQLKSFHVEYDALAIPPHSSARFTGDCSVASDVAKATGVPFAAKVYYVLPHTHTLGTHVFAAVMGGPHDGETLLDIGTFNGEPHGKSFDPPVDLAGSDGVQFYCQYANPRSTSVGWGDGQNEMCEVFAFAETSAFFESRVSSGQQMGSDGSVILFEGPCTTQVIGN